MAKIDHSSIGNVLEHVYLTATITAVDGSNDTVCFTGIGECLDGVDIPLFYHCAPDSALRDNGALEGAAGAFSVDDAVIVQCEIKSAEHYKPLRVIGFTDKPKACARPYIYATISDYVTIWDLETGEIAENINDVDGNVITFPCHKDKLEKWLEKVKDRPTRQVLKDNPVDNRDFLDDNKMDLGNENRIVFPVEDADDEPDYYGIHQVNFTNIVKDESESDCPAPVVLPSPGECTVRTYVEKDTPDVSAVTNYDVELCKDSWEGDEDKKHYVDTGPTGTERCYHTQSDTNYLELFYYYTKHLYLSSYPIDRILAEDSPYLNSVDMKYSLVTSKLYWGEFSGFVYQAIDDMKAFSYKKASLPSYETPFDYLAIDQIPVKDLSEDYVPLKEALRNGETLLTAEAICELDMNGIQTVVPEGLLKECSVVKRLIGSPDGDSTRFAVSWCGSPDPKIKTKNWYRVMLYFYTARAKRYECDTEVYNDTLVYRCPCSTEEFTYEDRLASVQATIELECPEKYPKENGIIEQVYKYRRPEEYSDEECSQLCAFPDRESGYPEEDNKCFPFDGTYDIYTLGEAVEKLINNHYEDGSDDQLLVYCLNH